MHELKHPKCHVGRIDWPDAGSQRAQTVALHALPPTSIVVRAGESGSFSCMYIIDCEAEAEILPNHLHPRESLLALARPAIELSPQVSYEHRNCDLPCQLVTRKCKTGSVRQSGCNCNFLSFWLAGTLPVLSVPSWLPTYIYLINHTRTTHTTVQKSKL